MATVTNHVPAAADLPRTDILGIEDRFPELVRITEELFDAPASVVIEADPELPDVRYAVFEATARGTLENLARLRHEWYERTAALLGDDCQKISLVLDWQE